MGDSFPQVKWLVIDGLPFWLVQKYLDYKTMPHLTHLMEQGKITPLEPLWPNCQTPPSLFSIWSGLPAVVHQIYGFDTPDKDQAGTYRNGFTRWPNQHTMVWESCAQAGCNIRLNHVPFVDETKLGNQLIARSSIYGEVFYESCIFTKTKLLNIGSYDITLTLQQLQDQQVLLHIEVEGIKITEKLILGVFSDIPLPNPLAGSLTLMVTLTTTNELEGALLGKNRYYRSGRNPMSTGHPVDTDFCHSSLAKLYRNNLLGIKKGQGGNGEAEKKLFDSLTRVHQSFYEELSRSFMQEDATLTVGYYPVIDMALHEILNLEILAQNDSEVAGYFHQIMQWVEAIVAMTENSCRESEIMVINSDHGMQPIRDIYFLNCYLAQLGWLTFDSQGGIDYNNTLVAYHPAENGTLLIHRSCNSEEVCQSICAFFNKFGLQGASVVRLSKSAFQQNFDIGWFLLPPDGIRVKASNSNQIVKLSDKGGDHCGYSPLVDLKGTLISNHCSTRPSIMHTYDIKSFILGSLYGY